MADKYVSTSGDNGNSGDGPGDSDAWLTIPYALANTSDNDVIWAIAGEYQDRFVITAAELNSETKTVRRYGSGRVLLSGNGINNYLFYASSGSGTLNLRDLTLSVSNWAGAGGWMFYGITPEVGFTTQDCIFETLDQSCKVVEFTVQAGYDRIFSVTDCTVTRTGGTQTLFDLDSVTTLTIDGVTCTGTFGATPILRIGQDVDTAIFNDISPSGGSGVFANIGTGVGSLTVSNNTSSTSGNFLTLVGAAITTLNVTGNSYTGTGDFIDPLVDGATTVTITDNTCPNCTNFLVFPTDAIGGRVTIRNNTIAATKAINWADSQGATPYDLLIEDNRFVRIGTSALVVIGKDTPSRNTAHAWGKVIFRRNTVYVDEDLATGAAHLVMFGGGVDNLVCYANEIRAVSVALTNYLFVIKGDFPRVFENRLFGPRPLYFVGSQGAVAKGQTIHTNTDFGLRFSTQDTYDPVSPVVLDNVLIAEGAGVTALEIAGLWNTHSDRNYFDLRSGATAGSINGTPCAALGDIQAYWQSQGGEYYHNDENSLTGDCMLRLTGGASELWRPTWGSPLRAASASGGDLGADRHIRRALHHRMLNGCRIGG